MLPAIGYQSRELSRSVHCYSGLIPGPKGFASQPLLPAVQKTPVRETLFRRHGASRISYIPPVSIPSLRKRRRTLSAAASGGVNRPFS